MSKKYYAVKQGKKTGIFTTWNECKQNVHGYPGAEYKSFTSKAQAENYLTGTQETDDPEKDRGTESEAEVVAYVDGSFNEVSSEFSYGSVIFYQGEQTHFAEKFSDPDLVSMRNVAGEIKGSERAMAFAVEKGAKSLTIHHDYEGISKWCTGEWKAKKPGTIAYKQCFDNIKNDVKVKFVKVKSHSGDEFNDLADKLAKDAFVQTEIVENSVDSVSENPKNIGIFVEPNKLGEAICSAGESEWKDFQLLSFEKVGNAKRCIFSVNDKQGSLDFYYRTSKGTTTMTPIGKNVELSSVLRDRIIEQSEYTDTGVSKSHTFRINKEWANKLVNFLGGLEDIGKDQKSYENPKYQQYNFVSGRGDRLNVNIYETGKVVLQGKPAYLYTEALSFLSYCPEVNINDVVEANNSFYEVYITVTDTRTELHKLMPNAFENIDDTLIKILSPAVSLKKIKMEIEDYSCYAFPALRALEGYLKYLFGIEGVEIGHNYGQQFGHDTKTGAFHLKKHTVQKLKNPKSEVPITEAYNYLNKNRHTLFHSEQLLFTTRILEDKLEADQIVNEVIDLIERTYTYLIA
ncbi:viroplasmin family protein [Alkalibacillus silvisoli]|uniref:ribonuclease H n=1 Tax=Alkalibacillus silvisoli TaxID=392823 RepID=A0ABN1A7G0_9BACI